MTWMRAAHGPSVGCCGVRASVGSRSNNSTSAIPATLQETTTEWSDTERSPLDEIATIRPVAPTAGDQLIDLADGVIVEGLDGRRAPVPDLSALHPDLHQRLGAFVTLTVRGELNGCIGSIEGEEPLGAAVARHAWSAAFADPRLPPLRRSDYPQLEIEVSVLSPLSPLPADSRRRPARRVASGRRRAAHRRRDEAGGVPAVGLGAAAVRRPLRRASLPQGRSRARCLAAGSSSASFQRPEDPARPPGFGDALRQRCSR